MGAAAAVAPLDAGGGGRAVTQPSDEKASASQSLVAFPIATSTPPSRTYRATPARSSSRGDAERATSRSVGGD
jgi:hypothetical protein